MFIATYIIEMAELNSWNKDQMVHRPTKFAASLLRKGCPLGLLEGDFK